MSSPPHARAADDSDVAEPGGHHRWSLAVSLPISVSSGSSNVARQNAEGMLQRPNCSAIELISATSQHGGQLLLDLGRRGGSVQAPDAHVKTAPHDGITHSSRLPTPRVFSVSRRVSMGRPPWPLRPPVRRCSTRPFASPATGGRMTPALSYAALDTAATRRLAVGGNDLTRYTFTDSSAVDDGNGN